MCVLASVRACTHTRMICMRGKRRKGQEDYPFIFMFMEKVNVNIRTDLTKASDHAHNLTNF